MEGYYKPFHTEATAFSAASRMLTCIGIVLCLLAVFVGGILTYFAVTDLIIGLCYHKFSHSLNENSIRIADGVLTYKDRKNFDVYAISTEEIPFIYLAEGKRNSTFLLLSRSIISPDHQKNIAVQASVNRRLWIDNCIAVNIDHTSASYEFVSQALAHFPESAALQSLQKHLSRHT